VPSEIFSSLYSYIVETCSQYNRSWNCFSFDDVMHQHIELMVLNFFGFNFIFLMDLCRILLNKMATR
jgi:hypothetical protein